MENLDYPSSRHPVSDEVVRPSDDSAPIGDSELRIRKTSEADLRAIMRIHSMAFSQDTEADLVAAIMADPSAEPVLSLMALEDDRPVGHILFSAARLDEPERDTPAAILAPLAIVPDAQRLGIGGMLVEAGLEHLSAEGTDLVFVLGHPDYYPRFGFEPAGQFGLLPPYPIAEEHADAWMVQGLRPGIIGSVRGKIVCCNALNQPEFWQE
jgi:putative acetyltransferase